MKSDNLISAFGKIDAELNLPEYLQEICSIIAKENITKEKVNKILFNYNINRSIAKVDFLHLIFAYIKIALEDDVLTTYEKEDIKFLKTLFQIQPGDFYFHNKSDVEKTITFQLSKIYQDSFVTEKEAELKVGIQEIFDLSFDQMNEYSKIKAAVSIQQGTDPKDLDVFFTYDEYFKLKSSSSN